jgi:hypothetical protein
MDPVCVCEVRGTGLQLVCLEQSRSCIKTRIPLVLLTNRDVWNSSRGTRRLIEAEIMEIESSRVVHASL